MNGRIDRFRGAGLVALTVIVTGVFVGLTYRSIFAEPHPNRLLGKLDSWAWFGPHAYFYDHSIQHGELPYWNPLIFCGQPFAANPQTAAFYPPNVLRAVLNRPLTPLSTHYSIWIMLGLHGLFAAVGLYLFCRKLKLGMAATGTAIVAYLFSASLTRHAVAHWHFIAIVSWLPFLLFAVTKYLTEEPVRRRFRWLTIAGLAFGVSVLPGFPEVTVYGAILLLAYALLFRVFGADESGRYRKGSALRQIGGDVGALAIALVIVLGISAATYLPGAELLRYTERAAASGDSIATTRYSASEILDYLVYYPGRIQNPGFRLAGAGVLILAVAGIGAGSRRPAILFGLSFGVMLDCALGPPFPISSLIRWLAPWEFGPSERAVVIAALPLAMLAGLGVEGAKRVVREGTERWIYVLVWGTFAAAILYRLTQVREVSNAIESSWWVVVFPGATAAALLCAMAWTRGSWLRYAIPVLLFAETLAWNVRHVPLQIERGMYVGETDFLTERASMWNSNRRIPGTLYNMDMYRLDGATIGYDPLRLVRTTDVLGNPRPGEVFLKSLSPEQVAEHNPFGYLFLKRPFWLAREYVAGPLPPKGRLWPPTRTAFIPDGTVESVPDVLLEDVPSSALSKPVRVAALNRMRRADDEDAIGFENPIVTTGGRHSAVRLETEAGVEGTVRVWVRGEDVARGYVPVAARIGGGGGWAEAALPDFEEAEVEALFDPAGSIGGDDIELEIFADEDDEDGLIEVTHRSANRVSVRVGDLPGPRVLVFVDSFYPGWRATVDGKPTPILRANDAFKAVEVPAGTHEIVFRFGPRRVFAGIAISFVTFATAVLGASVLYHRTGQSEE